MSFSLSSLLITISLSFGISAYAGPSNRGGEVGAGGDSVELKESYFELDSLFAVIEDSGPILDLIAQKVRPLTLVDQTKYEDRDELPVKKRRLRELGNLLYEQERDIKQVLSSMKVILKAQGPCVVKGVETSFHDGSAVIGSNAAVCLSYERLSSKLRSYEVDASVVGLLFHEAIHMLGGDETLAQLGQKLAMDFVSDLLVVKKDRHFKKISLADWNELSPRRHRKLQVKVNSLRIEVSKYVQKSNCLTTFQLDLENSLKFYLQRITTSTLKVNLCDDSIDCQSVKLLSYLESNHNPRLAYKVLSGEKIHSAQPVEDFIGHLALVVPVRSSEKDGISTAHLYLNKRCELLEADLLD